MRFVLRSKSFHANWKIERASEWAGRFLKRVEEGDLLAQPARRFFGISKRNANIGKVSRGWPSIMILASLEEDVFVIRPRRTILSEITSPVMTRCGLVVEAFQFFFLLFFFSGQEKPMETDYSWRKCDGKSIAGRCVERRSFSTTSGAFWRWNRGHGSDISRTRGNRFHFQWNEPSYSLRDGKCLFSSYSVTYNGESLLTSKRHNSLRYVCSFGFSPLEGEWADFRVTTTKASKFHEFFFTLTTSYTELDIFLGRRYSLEVQM